MKTVFIRAVEATVDEKAAVLRGAASTAGINRFDTDVSSFMAITGSPFSYWVSAGLRHIFTQYPGFESSVPFRRATKGLATTDDGRFIRLWWEVSVDRLGSQWWPFAKGGPASSFYTDLQTVIAWGSCDGNELKSYLDHKIGRPNQWSRWINSIEYYGRPGITWPLRAASFSPRPLPAGSVFSVRGYAAFVEAQDLLPTLGLLSSSVFDYLFKMIVGRTGHPEFVIGVMQLIPWPGESLSSVSEELSSLTIRAWSLKRQLDTPTEHSHAFTLPAILQADGESLVEKVRAWAQITTSLQVEINSIKSAINEIAYRIYGISAQDRQHIEDGFELVSDDFTNEADDDDGNDQDFAEDEFISVVGSFFSWCIGVVFGRFDVRLATGQRSAPPEPEPFDPLPVCSPGMLTGDDGLPLGQLPAGYPLAFPSDGLLVDDPGHPKDLISAVRSVFEVVFDDPDARWKEAAELLGTPELRNWFASEFFGPHIKRYSKSRRKAPIYWQFATPSGSYSVWLYIHRATADSLFRVLELVSQKLRHEEGRHAALLQEAGPSPSPSQRRELEQQESFLSELRGLKAEVARVAPLWRPDLDDGVILNFAPLWRLVPQLSSWQSECRNAWEKLIAEHYDWAHLAMHLWPERVVPKCQADRSLAIAHCLEATFWFEDQDGTWRQREVAEATIQQLIAERSSAAVKAALQDLLAAPAPVGRSTRRAVRAPRRTTPRQPAQPAGPDPALLNQVQAAIATVPDGASRADVLAATGISAAQWTAAIRALLAAGSVSQTGERRGARYHLSSGGTP